MDDASITIAKAGIKELKDKQRALQRQLSEFEQKKGDKTKQEKEENFQRLLQVNRIEQKVDQMKVDLRQRQIVLDVMLPWKLRIKVRYESEFSTVICSIGYQIDFVNLISNRTNHSIELFHNFTSLDIALGMQFLHGVEPPICHRDLRSPNIFVRHLTFSSHPSVGECFLLC